MLNFETDTQKDTVLLCFRNRSHHSLNVQTNATFKDEKTPSEMKNLSMI